MRRPLIVVVPDGAAERGVGVGGTSLERADLPALDRLAAANLARVRTIPPGLPAGTEVGLPTVLGVGMGDAPGRGFIEAAAAGVDVPEGAGAWRLDLVERGGSPWLPARPEVVAADLARDLHAEVIHLRGHRFLLVGPAGWGDAPPPPHAPPLTHGPTGAPAGPWAGRLAASHAALPAGVRCIAWGTATRPRWSHALPRHRAVMVAAGSGAAAGVARLLGFALVSPSGATGGTDSDLAAKTAAVLDALDGGADVVVVHVGAADEAAHARDSKAKREALERLDREVVAPLLDLATELGAALWVCPDHGTDPGDGRHLADPVPSAWWLPGESLPGEQLSRRGADFSEAAAAVTPVRPGASMLAGLLARLDQRAA